MPNVKTELHELEREYQSRLRDVDLLGELGLTDAERTRIARYLRVLLANISAERVCQYVHQYWPVTLAVYLVAEGVVSYDGGNFWDPVCANTDLPHPFTSRWGQTFEHAVKFLGKPTFARMVVDQRTTRYVAPILAHGGIPDSCLDNFFLRVLHAGSRKARWSASDADDLIADWRGRRDPLPFAPEPVRRFLMFGNGVARDFLDRSLEMTRRAADGEDYSAAAVGLPERVVNRYRDFLSHLSPEERDRSRNTSDRAGARFARPFLHFDPWGHGVSLMLPEQALPPDLLERAVEWTLASGGRLETVRVPIRRRGRNSVVEATFLWLPGANASYSIALSAGDDILRRWELPGLVARRPLLAFAPASGRQIDVAEALPADTVWLIWRKGQSLDVCTAAGGAFAPARVIEALPEPGDGLAGYQAAHVDLRGSIGLRLRVDGSHESLEIAVRERIAEPVRPQLAGAAPLDAVVDSGDGPLYAGELPDLRIPLEDAAAAGRWQIELRPSGAATPATPSACRLTDVPYAFDAESKTACVPTAHLLGDAPAGAFRLVVRGPLGQDAILRLRAVPVFHIDGAGRLVLPGDAGSVTVRTGEHMHLDADGDDTTVVPLSVPNGDRTWTVTPEPGGIEAGVHVRQVLPEGGMLDLPIRVAVRRLRWCTLGVEGGDHGLRTQRSQVGREALEAAEQPRLVLDVPANGEHASYQVALQDVDGERQATEWQAVPVSGRCVVALGGFRDSVRLSARSRLELVLRLRRGAAEPVSIPLVAVVQDVVARGLSAEVAAADGQQRIEARWESDRAVKDRALLLWSLRRPLDPPRVIAVPDDAQGDHVVVLDPPLTAGRYRMTMGVLDPWTGVGDARLPRAGAANTVDLRLLNEDAAADGRSTVDDVLDRLFGARASGEPRVEPIPRAELLLRLLSGRIRSSYGQASERYAHSLLTDDLCTLLAAVAELAAALSENEERGLIPLLVQAGAGMTSAAQCAASFREATEDLWRVWPPLGLFADLDAALAGDDTAAERCRHGLGADAFAPADDDEERGAVVLGGVPAGLASLIEQVVRSSDERLRRAAAWAADLRTGLLGGGALVQARFDSVQRIANDEHLQQRVRHGLQNSIAGLDKAFRTVRSRATLPRYLCDEIDGRRDRERTLPNVPYFVAVTALLQRLAVRRPETVASLFNAPTLPMLGTLAFEMAPLLYERDLCFMELVIASTAAPALAVAIR